MRNWSKAEIIAILTLLVGIAACGGTYLTIPGFQAWLNGIFSQNKNEDVPAEPTPSETPAPASPVQGSKETTSTKKKSLYRYSKDLIEGETFVDPYTGASLGVSQIYSSNRADVSVTLPGKKTEHIDWIQPGTAWEFQRYGSTFLLILTKVRYEYRGHPSFQVEIHEARK